MADKYNIGRMLREDKDPSLFRESTELVCNNTAVGVEIELESINYRERWEGYPDLFKYWAYHEDGSLRGGSEYVFRKPFTGENIIQALKTFDDFVSHYDSRNPPISLSDRTSVHVHIDVRDMDDEEIINFTLWYILVERLLFAQVDPSRIKNNHCVPITDSDFIKSIGSIALLRSGHDNYERTNSFLRVVGERCDKYCAFNLLPLRSFGSIEFRHHHGTKDYKDILKWINLIFSVKTFAHSNDIKKSLYSDINLLDAMFKNVLTLDKSDDIIQSLFTKGCNDVFQVLNHTSLSSDTNKKLHEVLAICKIPSKSTIFFKFKKANDLLPKQKEI